MTMDKEVTPDIISRIEQCYHTLSRSQKLIAEFICKHPEDACFFSLKELTEAVGSTEVTVVNFTKRIGVGRFLGLKKGLQEYIRMRLTPNDKMYRAMGGVSDRSGIYSDFLENERVTLCETFEHLKFETLDRAVSMIKNASNVYVIGHDSSMPVSAFLLMRLHYLGIRSTELSFADPSGLLLEVSQAAKDALFILVSFPIHAAQMEGLSQTLFEQGLQSLIITDRTDSRVTQNATLSLTCSTDDLLFYNSITAPISVINLISSLLAVESKEHVRKVRDRVQELNTQVYGNLR